MILWFFDSRGGNYYQEEAADGSSVGQPNWVGSSVTSWFERARDNLASTYGTSLPSLAFVHIPVDPFLAFQKEGLDANTEPGINAEIPLSQQGVASGQGNSDTVFTYDSQDVPFMQALVEPVNLMSVFSWHDHGNDWCFKWNSKLTGIDSDRKWDEPLFQSTHWVWWLWFVDERVAPAFGESRHTQ